MFKRAGNGIDFFQGIQGKEYLSIFSHSLSDISGLPRHFYPAQTSLVCVLVLTYTAQTDLLHWRRQTFRWTVGGLLWTLIVLDPYFIFSYCAASTPLRDLLIFCGLFFLFHEWLSRWCSLAARQSSWMTITLTVVGFPPGAHDSSSAHVGNDKAVGLRWLIK